MGWRQSVITASLVIVYGTGSNTGLFVYSGTPSASNPPIFWATSASTDPYGTALPSTTGVSGTGTFQAGDTVITPAGFFVYSATPAKGNLIASIAKTAGTDSFGNSYLIGFATYSNSAGVPVSAQNMLGPVTRFWLWSGTAWTLGPQLSISQVGTNSLNVIEQSGLVMFPDLSEIDTATYTNDGSTANAIAISATYTVPANDMQAGTVYVLEVPFTGIQEGQTVTWGLSPDGGTSVARDGIGSSFFSAGGNFVGTVKARVHVLTTGATGTVLYYLDGGVGLSGIRSSGANNNDSYLSGIGTGGTIDTTVSHTFAMTAQFGGISAGQTVVGYGSTFTRKGP